MFGLGMWEILIILALALIFIGPKKLPDLARNLGRGLREFKNAANEIRVDLQQADDAEEKKKPEPAALPEPGAASQPAADADAVKAETDNNDGGRA